ncbi:MAG: hypothetical protein OHK0022_13110 [Roseiflexaceae bacterium]
MRHIEVTQAIQCETNMIPLVAGRPAIARVYIAVAGSEAPVPGVTALLYASRDGALLPGAPLSPYNPGGQISAPPAPDREQAEHTLNFLLPAEWLAAGQITLWAEVNPQRTVAEERFDDNRSEEQNLTLHTVPDLRVVLVPIAYQPGGTGPVYRPTMDASNDYGMGKIESMFPIASIQRQVHSEYLVTSDLSIPENWGTLLSEVAEMRSRELPSWSTFVFYYAVVPGFRPRPMDGIGYIGGTLAAVGVESVYSIAAHEFGHNLGLWHTECFRPAPPHEKGFPRIDGTIGQTAVDLYTREIMSAKRYDMMSYCYPQWISDYNYMRLFQIMRKKGAVPQIQTAPQDALVLSGRISADGQSGLLHYAVPLSVTTALEQAAAGDYRVELRDSSGALLLSRSFAPDQLSHRPNRLSPLTFSVKVPRPDDLARVELWRGGQRLDVLDAAPAPDLAAQATPDPHAPGRLTIAWQATHPQALPVDVSLRYSADGGQNWQVLALRLPGDSTTIDTARLPASPAGLIAVDADGPTEMASVLLPIGPVGR